MGAARKFFILFVAFLSLCVIWPMQRSDAAKITDLRIFWADFSWRPVSEIIAGVAYYYVEYDDKAASTEITKFNFNYSADNGATWIELPSNYSLRWRSNFVIPIEPQLTSVLFRAVAYFDPLIGAKSYSEKIIGPYKILQPADASDFTATPNDDGTVTLKWNDNSNMESYYRIVRSGPDGDKTFRVNNTKEHIGPFSYVDKETNRLKSTIYGYSLTPVIDQYDLPDHLQPVIIRAFVKTKGPVSEWYKFVIDPNAPLIPDMKNKIDPNAPLIPDMKNKIDPDTPIQKVDAFKYLVDFNLDIGDLDKAAPSAVELDKKSIFMKEGESESLTATVSPAYRAIPKIAWSSDNKQVAEVDSSGKVTGKSPGVAKITVNTEVGNFTDVCIVTVIANSEPTSPVIPAISFTDLAGHKASAEIEEAVALGVVFGYPDGTFRPDGSVTRAEFASMLVRGLKLVEEGATLTFKDKDTIGAWAVKPVQQAVKLGIISGYSDGTFRPNTNITPRGNDLHGDSRFRSSHGQRNADRLLRRCGHSEMGKARRFQGRRDRHHHRRGPPGRQIRAAGDVHPRGSCVVHRPDAENP